MVCRYRVTSIIVICLWLLNPTSSIAQQKPSIAVLDMDGRGIAANEATVLTDRLRVALVRTGDINVVERGQMNLIFTVQQNFQCSSIECAVEAGKLLGVTSVLVGSISRVDSSYSIDTRIIDVQSGQITYSQWHYYGEIDNLIAEMVPFAGTIVNELIGEQGQAIRSVPETRPIDTKFLAKTNIAITTLDAIGISPSECLALTNRLRYELFNTGAFRVLDRGEMDEIFAEIGFQETGCTTTECIVQVGQLLNVAQIVAGSVAKVGNVYTTEIRLVDVETGEIVAAEVDDIYGSIDAVLLEGMTRIASKLVR